MIHNRIGLTRFSIVICFFSCSSSALAIDITAATSSSQLTLGDSGNIPQSKQFETSDTDNTLDGVSKDTSATTTESYGRAFGDITASAHAEIADLGVKFIGNGEGSNFGTTQFNTFSVASWRDTGKVTSDLQISPIVFNVLLAVTSPTSVPTHAGGFSVTTDTHGSMDGTYEIKSLSSFYQFPPGPYPIFGQTVWGSFHQDGTGLVQDFPTPEFIPVRMVFCNGCDFEVGFQVILRGSGTTSGAGSTIWIGDFSGSLHWGGIQSVTDESGNPISSDHWHITSESGFDYSKPFGIPEPSSVQLFAICLSASMAFRGPLLCPSR